MLNNTIQYYGPCPGCYGFLLKSDLWRHVCKCKQDKVVQQEKSQQRGCVQGDSRLLLIADDTMPDEAQFRSEVLFHTQDDGITRIACKDWIIRRLGYSVHEKHGSSQRKVRYRNIAINAYAQGDHSPDTMKFPDNSRRFATLLIILTGTHAVMSSRLPGRADQSHGPRMRLGDHASLDTRSF